MQNIKREINTDIIDKELEKIWKNNHDLQENIIDNLYLLELVEKETNLDIKKISRNIFRYAFGDIRILYGKHNNIIYCVSVFVKKKNKLGQHNIDIAEKRFKAII